MNTKITTLVKQDYQKSLTKEHQHMNINKITPIDEHQ